MRRRLLYPNGFGDGHSAIAGKDLTSDEIGTLHQRCDGGRNVLRVADGLKRHGLLEGGLGGLIAFSKTFLQPATGNETGATAFTRICGAKVRAKATVRL